MFFEDLKAKSLSLQLASSGTLCFKGLSRWEREEQFSVDSLTSA